MPPTSATFSAGWALQTKILLLSLAPTPSAAATPTAPASQARGPSLRPDLVTSILSNSRKILGQRRFGAGRSNMRILLVRWGFFLASRLVGSKCFLIFILSYRRAYDASVGHGSPSRPGIHETRPRLRKGQICKSTLPPLLLIELQLEPRFSLLTLRLVFFYR